MCWPGRRAPSTMPDIFEDPEVSEQTKQVCASLSALTPKLYLTVAVEGQVPPAANTERDLSAAEGNHIWLNAFRCYDPSEELKLSVGQSLAEWLSQAEQPMLRCSINKS